MTYDPLSYGQIKLRDRAANPGETPDDLLFEDAGPGYASDEPPASDWGSEPESGFREPPDSANFGEVSQFGADVLGESTPTSMPDPMPAPTPMPSPVPVPAPRPAVARRRLSPGGAPAVAPAKPPAPANKLPRRSAAERVRRGVNRPGRMMGTLMPSIVIAGGGSAAGWFYMMEQNMVMAGIVGAISLVGAALARVMFR